VVSTKRSKAIGEKEVGRAIKENKKKGEIVGEVYKK
jgi:hypothetical protein